MHGMIGHVTVAHGIIEEAKKQAGSFPFRDWSKCL